jgi:hypothetical protein
MHMDDGSSVVPQDPKILGPLLMKGASTVRQVEAAERLVLQIPTLRSWLIEKQFLLMYESQAGSYAATDFARAYAEATEIKRRGGDEALKNSGLSESCWSVLGVAANLSGRVANSLRYAVHDIGDEDATLVAEAVLYAFGFMDATVDVCGGNGDRIGPNELDYERRLSGA